MNQLEHIDPKAWSFVSYNTERSELSTWWLSRNEAAIGDSIRYSFNVKKPPFGNPKFPEVNYKLHFAQKRLISWLNMSSQQRQEILRDSPDLYFHFEHYYHPKTATNGIAFPLSGMIADYNFTEFDGELHIYDSRYMGVKKFTCYNWKTGSTHVRDGSDIRSRPSQEFSKLPPGWRRTAQEENPVMFELFEKAYRGSDFDIDKSTNPYREFDLPISPGNYGFVIIKNDIFLYKRHSQANLFTMINWKTGENVEISRDLLFSHRVYGWGDLKSELKKENPLMFPQFDDCYDPFDNLIPGSAGSWTSEKAKKLKTAAVGTAEYLLSSDKSSKWQKAAAENYLKGQKAHEDTEKMFRTLANTGYLLTNNSPNNTHTNEQFKLPTKVRSLPGGKRLTSSIIQSTSGKNPTTTGYSVSGRTVSPGRKPVRGR